MGSAIQYVIAHEPVGSVFGRKEDEEWVFLSSKDCDLRYVPTLPYATFIDSSLFDAARWEALSIIYTSLEAEYELTAW